jgi:hypothetical protein
MVQISSADGPAGEPQGHDKALTHGAAMQWGDKFQQAIGAKQDPNSVRGHPELCAPASMFSFENSQQSALQTECNCTETLMCASVHGDHCT